MIEMSNQETFYLVEYATVATYYRVEAVNRDEATTKMYDGSTKGIESQDRIDVEIQDADVEDYEYVKSKNDWRIANG